MSVIGLGNRVMSKVGWIFSRRLFNWSDFSEILKSLFCALERTIVSRVIFVLLIKHHACDLLQCLVHSQNEENMKSKKDL